jgi:predicted transcriptional regulator
MAAMEVVSSVVKPSLNKKLDELARLQRRSKSSVIRLALEDYFKGGRSLANENR